MLHSSQVVLYSRNHHIFIWKMNKVDTQLVKISPIFRPQRVQKRSPSEGVGLSSALSPQSSVLNQSSILARTTFSFNLYIGV